jgi:hypothetical protein
MVFLLGHPVIWLAVSFLFLYFAARLGVHFRALRGGMVIVDDKDFDLVVGATLTLLALIIGFTFSMAITRYDLRKNLEEAEANAIGTEYLRADLVPPTDAAKIRQLLREYSDTRILYYTTRNAQALRQIDSRTAQLQTGLWNSVTAVANPRDQVTALVLSGMNDVLNSQGYTEAAWRNRVPLAAWMLLVVIAFFSNLLLGVRSEQRSWILLLILPIALSVSFFLIADIDSPRSGIIRVHPENLQLLADSLRAQ